MKNHFGKTLVRLSAGLFCAALFSSCSGLVQLRYENQTFTGGGVTYVPASATYEPTAVGDAYAFYADGDTTFYEIPGQNPKEWLTEEYVGSATTVLAADSITLPDWESFDAQKIYVCVSEETTVSVDEITDPAVIDALLQAFLHGETTDWPDTATLRRFELKFSSTAWPQIYMNMTYAEVEEGTFLYERATRHAVRVEDDLLALLPDSLS